jgi:xylulokinase
LPISIPEPGEYVADGAARQAAWVLDAAAKGADVAPPAWATKVVVTMPADEQPVIREQYAAATASLYGA